jgi:hypothetical protein
VTDGARTPDVRGKRAFGPKRHTCETERVDWEGIAHDLLNEAITIPDIAMNYPVARDCLVLVNIIVMALRNDRRRPLNPDLRLIIRFKGAEYNTLIAFSKANPRQEDHIVHPSN